MSAKIVNHCFHGLYLFDYLKKEFENGSPEYLYADWPIINCVPKAEKGDEGFKEFSSIEDARKFANQNGSSITFDSGSSTPNVEEDKDPPNNFITFGLKDLSKFRGFFHGLLKSVGADHNFNLTIDGNTKGTITRTCCIPTPISFMAEYKGEGGHCCDRAVFSFSAGGKRLGTINLNNASDCGNRSSGPFNLTKEEVEKALVDEFIEIELTAQVDDPHGSVTAMEVKDTQSGTVIASVGVTEGISSVPACSRPDNDYSDEICCCPPKFRKTDGSTGKSSSSIAKGYACERKHSKKIEGKLKIDSFKILEESQLQNRISPAFIIYEVSEAPIEPSSSSSSGSRKTERNELLYIASPDPVFKDNWVFEQEVFKDLFRIGGSSSSSSVNNKKFPNNTTLINDPVLVSLNQEKFGYPGKLANLFVTIASNEKNKDPNPYLSSNREVKSTKIGDLSLKINQENCGVPITDNVTYRLWITLNKAVFLPSKKEYIFFIDLTSEIVMPSHSITWEAGDYLNAEIQHKDGKKFYESFRPKFVIDGGTEASELLHGGPVLSTSRQDLEAITGAGEKANGKIKKINIKTLLKLDSGEQELSFECLRFEKQKIKASYNRSSSSSSDARVCLDGDVTASWNLDDLKIRFNSWLEEDFSEEATFPPAVV